MPSTVAGACVNLSAGGGPAGLVRDLGNVFVCVRPAIAFVNLGSTLLRVPERSISSSAYDFEYMYRPWGESEPVELDRGIRVFEFEGDRSGCN